MDSRLIFRPLFQAMTKGGRRRPGPSGVTDIPVQPLRRRALGKSGARSSRGGMRSRYGGEGGQVSGQEKPLGSLEETVPQTDTGRRGENPQVGERNLVKELGKMTP